jgi:pimeloyl-ACP methyl ester carboxylesterase
MQFRTIHGYRRAFFHLGHGPALLFIHGIGDSSVTWMPLLQRLAQDFTVIAPDLLGHGASSKPRADYSVAAYANAMRDLLTVLGIDSATIVGHSLGGGVAMQFAYQFPERCERLVLVSTGGISREVHPVLRLASAPNADLLLPLLNVGATRHVARAAFRLLQLARTNIGHDSEDFMRVFDALPDATARRAFVRTLRAVVDWRGQVITVLDRCYLIRHVPTLLIWGTRDGVLPYRHARLAHEAMPLSRLELFEGAGHFPHRTNADRFIAVLKDFMATTAPAAYEPERWQALLRTGRREASEDAHRLAEESAIPSLHSGT